MSNQESGQQERVDVLVVTALKDEFDAVLQVQDGAVSKSSWEIRPGPTGFDVALCTFHATDGNLLRIAVIQALTMGAEATAIDTSPLVHAYAPRCVAMCGICAGRKGDVEQGDVIIASRVWTYDTGKLTREIDDSGRSVQHHQGEVLSYSLPSSWLRKAEAFGAPAGSSWLLNRPQTYASQTDWMLEHIFKGDDPSQSPERKAKCPDYREVLTLLWKRAWLDDGTLRLTEAGRQHIQRQLHLHPDGLPSPKPFRVHVGPIGTGSQVVKDPHVFERLANQERKLLGLEMEASAIGAIAYRHQVPMLVMKGVTDFADLDKDDHFRPFAARASAECLIAFLRENLHGASASAFQDVLKPGTSTLPANLLPSTLLTARHGIVPFFETGREALLKDLRAWCDHESLVSAQLFHGAGGIGKTRLFIEWCKRLRQEGWWAGFLDEAADLNRIKDLLSSAPRLLLVIDYAESFPSLRHVLRFVADCRNAGRGSHLRVVLLARTVGDWWYELQASHGHVRDLMGDKLPTEVPPLAPAESERRAVFKAAVQCFAERRGRTPPQASLPALDDQRFNRVLYVHMAAMATVDGLSFTADSLMEEVLDHEERFWSRQAPPTLRDSEERRFKDRVRRIVTAITLRGGISGQLETEALISRLGGPPDAALLTLLQDLYPGDRTSANAISVNGLEPDLLGEAMVLRTLRKHGDTAGRLLEHTFVGADARAIRTGFEVMGRISAEYAEETAPWIAGLLDHDLPTRAVAALEAAKSVGLRTAHASLGKQLARALERNGTPEIALRLDEAGLPDHTIVLREVALWATKTQLRHLPLDGSVEHLATRAGLLNNLGNRQGELGMREAALASLEKAVELFRKLAKSNPSVFLPKLAMGLNNQSIQQSELGMREKALDSSREAVEQHRKLVKVRPDEFLADLAKSLNTLSNQQSELGMRRQAADSTLEAVSHLRKLARAFPDTFTPELAMALHNLGNRQADLGMRKEALLSAQEATTLCRKLEKMNPDAFLPLLASSLNSLSSLQSDLGMQKEALASIGEAVAIRRKLAVSQPDAFLPELAMSLSNLGLQQNEMEMLQESLNSSLEAVQHYRSLAKLNPNAFLAELSMSLHNLGKCQGEMELHEDALRATEEAVALRRKLTDSHKDTFLPDLALSLSSLSSQQIALGKKEVALASAQEAVKHYRVLVESSPEAHLPGLAMSLNNLAQCQSELGMGSKAMASVQEAIESIWPLFLDLPRAHEPLTRVLLQNMYVLLDQANLKPDGKLLATTRAFERITLTR